MTPSIEACKAEIARLEQRLDSWQKEARLQTQRADVNAVFARRSAALFTHLTTKDDQDVEQYSLDNLIWDAVEWLHDYRNTYGESGA